MFRYPQGIMKKLPNFKQHLIQFTGLTDIAFSKGLRKNVDITIAHVVKLPMLAGLRPILYEPRRGGNTSSQILLVGMEIDLNTMNSLGENQKRMTMQQIFFPKIIRTWSGRAITLSNRVLSSY